MISPFGGYLGCEVPQLIWGFRQVYRCLGDLQEPSCPDTVSKRLHGAELKHITYGGRNKYCKIKKDIKHIIRQLYSLS